MPIKKLKNLPGILSLCLSISCFVIPAHAAISKTSKRVMRSAPAPLINVPDFTVAALSTSSLQWSWSTAPFTSPGVDGYHLYTSSASQIIDLSLGTSFYIDTGLAVDKQYTRWVTAYKAGSQGSDSDHLVKYTYALPPATITVSTVLAESAFVTWKFSAATAYEIECSTDNGTDYVRNRDSFVPWQTIPLLSNKNYLIRMGAINGDNELTPGLYSIVETTTTPPITPVLTAVAISSWNIQWQWSTGTFTGTGISGYRLYRSTTAADDSIPTDDYAGAVVADVAGEGTGSWIEPFVDGSSTTVAANSRHTRWLKAVGIIESQRRPIYQKYTYAIAPATCTVYWLDPDPYLVAHVSEHSISLIWNPRMAPSEASQYTVDHTTSANFALTISSEIAAANPYTSEIASGNPFTVAGLTDNTKYDLWMGAINGDGEQTPADGLNPFAYSQVYKTITDPPPPYNFAATALTDTVLNFTWSTSTYKHPDYIAGYTIAERIYNPVTKMYEWFHEKSVPGVASSSYSLDYLITNSTHTRWAWATQTDPDWVAGAPHYPIDPECQYHYCPHGSYAIDATGATFATPPNDVVFDTITAHSISTYWKEPEVPATSYRLERSTTTGEKGPWVFVSSVVGNAFTDTGLIPSTTYSYRIGAVNLLGVQTLGLADATTGYRRDYSFVRTISTLQKAPLLYADVLSPSSIKWRWETDVPLVLSYNLYTGTDGVIASNLPLGTTSLIEVNLPSANARYTRRIRSVTAQGEGDFSEVSVYTFANPPSSLTLSSAGVHSLSIDWSGNGGSQFKIDRSTDLAGWTTLKSLTDVYVSTSFTDTHLHLATTYYYAVTGYNRDGIPTLSSATSSAFRTLDLPAGLKVILSSAAAAQSQTVPIPGLGFITVELPPHAAAVDGYILISTNAGTAPVGASPGDLSSAAGKLLPNMLVPGYLTEIYFYDLFGNKLTGNFSAPVKIYFTYPDANNDDLIDGTTPPVGVSALKIMNLDTTDIAWDQLDNSVLDKTSKTVYAYINHFSFYALGNLVSAVGALTDVYAYPNPYKPGTGGAFDRSVFGDGIVFQSLPAKAKIRIYDLSGGLVAKLEDADGDGRCLWNVKNEQGGRVASGVYIYLVTSGGGVKSGKISIIR